MTTLQAELTQLIAQEKKLLDQLGGVPVMGDAQLNADQLAAWYQSTGQRAKLDDGTTIADLAKIYIEEGAAEHVRGDIAFAQSIVETGSFSVAPGNNFAASAPVTAVSTATRSATPRDASAAQIQLLKSYADPDSVAATLANPPSPGRCSPARRRTTPSSSRARCRSGTRWATATGRRHPTTPRPSSRCTSG